MLSISITMFLLLASPSPLKAGHILHAQEASLQKQTRYIFALRDSRCRSAEPRVLPQTTASASSPMLKSKGKQKVSVSTGTVVHEDRRVCKALPVSKRVSNCLP